LVLEPVGMVLIAGIGLIMVLQEGVTNTLPLLGALALGAQRLLPVVQKVYEGWAQSRNAKASLVNVLRLLEQPLPLGCQLVEPAPLHLKRSIQFNAVYFAYASHLPDVLQGLSLEIGRGERVGLIGSTGSGKTTALDLLMGLLKPSSGRILVDGADLHDSDQPQLLKAWRASIAHVPQSIYLADSTIVENIAFGVPRHQIDLQLVRQAAGQAQIAEFIESSPHGYDTFVGERGIFLSGGQRQRIGIARALYRQAHIIVLDEATSALDMATEQSVMDAIEGLSRELTIVIVTHRLSTVEKCDRLFRIHEGRIVNQGLPQEILPMQ